jgi:ABC-type transport system involved in multi-copper enzyme maturation permease subunit
MPLDAARYHAWHGVRRPPGRAAGAILRTTVLQLVRRKAYWIVLAMGLGQFIVYASVIYALTQMQLPPRSQENLLRQFNFSTSPEDPQESGYLQFMEAQSLVVMLLSALCGSLVVGADFRDGVLPFYLSRRMERKHYVVGKLGAIVVVVWSLTLLPALGLFIEYGLFTTSLDYWRDNWRIVPALLGYGAVLGGVLAVWLASLSAYLQKLAPIAVTWSSLFVLLGRLALTLRDATGDVRWLLLDPWRDLRLAGRLFFGVFKTATDRQLSIEAAAILTVVTVIALAALVHRVRAVEVVS